MAEVYFGIVKWQELKTVSPAKVFQCVFLLCVPLTAGLPHIVHCSRLLWWGIINSEYQCLGYPKQILMAMYKDFLCQLTYKKFLWQSVSALFRSGLSSQMTDEIIQLECLSCSAAHLFLYISTKSLSTTSKRYHKCYVTTSKRYYKVRWKKSYGYWTYWWGSGVWKQQYGLWWLTFTSKTCNFCFVSYQLLTHLMVQIMCFHSKFVSIGSGCCTLKMTSCFKRFLDCVWNTFRLQLSHIFASGLQPLTFWYRCYSLKTVKGFPALAAILKMSLVNDNPFFFSSVYGCQ